MNLSSSKYTDYNTQYEETIKSLALMPNNVLARKKAAYLSLFMGKIDEAYHWSASLNFYHGLTLQKIRQTRIELFKKKSANNISYQVVPGFYVLPQEGTLSNTPYEGEVWASNPQREVLLKNILSCQTIAYYKHKIFSKTSLKRIKETMSPCSYEPGVEMEYQEKYKNLPNTIIGYWYYAGFIHQEGKTHAAVFRVPEYPSNDQEIDFFTDGSNPLEIKGGEHLICYFSQPPEKKDDWLECKLKMHSIFSQNNQQFGSSHAFYQAHEAWGLPGQRPTLARIKEYSLTKWIQPHHEILDIGCNIGCFGIEAARTASHYTGFDINPDLIEIAKTLAENKHSKNCTFLTTDFHRFIQSNEKKYDFIFSFAVHGWIGLPMKNYVDILKSILKPDGFVLIESHDVINDDDLQKFFQQMRFFIEGNFSIVDQGMLKDDNKRRRSFFIFRLGKQAPA